MSWWSLAARSLSIFALWPLVLREFTPEAIAVWQLVSIVSVLTTVFDFGFAPTIARFVAYSLVDEPVQEGLRAQPHDARFPRVRLLPMVFVVYTALSLLLLFSSATLGSVALARPISALSTSTEGWTAWGAAVVFASIGLLNGGFVAILQGCDRIATLKRWEALLALGAAATGVVVLIGGGGLVPLVVGTSLWQVIGLVCYALVVRHHLPQVFALSVRPSFDRGVMDALWPATWRSGVGVALTSGVQNLSGVALAQMAPAAEVAAYMLAVRICSLITQLAQAPFYSKLPRLNFLRLAGRTPQLEALAGRGMRLAYLVLALGSFGTLVFLPQGLDLTGSNIDFVPQSTWVIMMAAMFFERFGAMHLQLYTTTNRVRWHVAAAGFAGVYFVVAAVLMPNLGSAGLAVGWLAASLLFYAPYCTSLSYSIAGFDSWSFEKRVTLPVAVVLTLATTLWLLLSRLTA